MEKAPSCSVFILHSQPFEATAYTNISYSCFTLNVFDRKNMQVAFINVLGSLCSFTVVRRGMVGYVGREKGIMSRKCSPPDSYGRCVGPTPWTSGSPGRPHHTGSIICFLFTHPWRENKWREIIRNAQEETFQVLIKFYAVRIMCVTSRRDRQRFGETISDFVLSQKKQTQNHYWEECYELSIFQGL